MYVYRSVDSSRLAPTHLECIFICSSWNIEQRLCQQDDDYDEDDYRFALYATQLGNSFDLCLPLLLAIDYNVLLKHDDERPHNDTPGNCLLN